MNKQYGEFHYVNDLLLVFTLPSTFGTLSLMFENFDTFYGFRCQSSIIIEWIDNTLSCIIKFINIC